MTNKTKFISITDFNDEKDGQGLDLINLDYIIRAKQVTLQHENNVDAFCVEISLVNGDKIIAFCGDKSRQEKLMREISYQNNTEEGQINVFDY